MEQVLGALEELRYSCIPQLPLLCVGRSGITDQVRCLNAGTCGWRNGIQSSLPLIHLPREVGHAPFPSLLPYAMLSPC